MKVTRYPLFEVCICLLLLVAAASLRAAPYGGTQAARATTASAAFDADGVLWVVSPRAGHVWLRRSYDFGRSFTPAIRLNPEPESIAADGDNRPKIHLTDVGKIFVSYTRVLDQPYTGDIRLIRSDDGGRSFQPPVTINDNHELISHRFDALQATDDGHVWLTWLDKRDQAAAARRGDDYTGAALYAAVSTDGGESFAPNVKLADHSCECCRVALALDTDGIPVVFWRHVFGSNTRDHAMLRLDGESALVRVGHDQWQVDACPHHGPALSIGSDGVYHFAWYTGASGENELRYLRSDNQGEDFAGALRFGAAQVQAGHPDVLSLGERVVLVWKEFDGRRTTIRAQVSTDAGRSWGEARPIAHSSGPSDHPTLVAHGQRVFLSWSTLEEGYRLLEIDPAGEEAA